MLNHPICEGNYFYEIKILKSENENSQFDNNPHVRVGIATI